MKKGLLSIPVYNQNYSISDVTNEVIKQVVNADKWGLNEAFFGEHITDRHEKITSSLLMVSALSKLTKNIKLGTLTTNLNFYKPAVVASLVSMADNLTQGRLMLGIGSGANMSDIEAIGLEDKNNHALTLEIESIIQKLLTNDNLIDIKTDNFKVSTKKFGSEELGLGFFNHLHNNRKDLDILMPALNKNSYNVKLCAKNKWSIVISNFCSDEIIENHIESYIKESPLGEDEAFKKIKLSKIIFANKLKDKGKTLVYSDKSPFMQVTDIIFKKLKKYNKHQCFGENINSSYEAGKQIILYGHPEEITSKIKSKYEKLSSIIYITVPITNNMDFDNSLEIFSKDVSI